MTKNTYDGPGNLASMTVAAGTQNESETDYTYDAANELVNVVQSISPGTTANSTLYGYDPLGNPDSLEDASSHQTIQNFNLLSELTGKTLPDGTLTESRTYDSNGNLHTVNHFNGVSTTYIYDQLNRLLSRATPGETTVSFTYTNTGKRHTMTDASGTTTYTYDNMDRLTSKQTPEGTLSYTYDAAGNLATMTSSNTHGVSVTYQYDTLNRLSAVVDNNLTGQNTTNYLYDTASNVDTVTYPNTVQSTFTYDPMNRVTGLSSQRVSYSYHRDFAGNLTTGTEEPSGRTVGWSYDGIYRLTNETISLAPSGKNGEVSYGLDPVGNRTSVTSTIPDFTPISGAFNQDDELASEGYDQNGNVIASGGKTFSYNSQDQLVSMNGGAIQIIYDGDGNRVAKTVVTNGVPTTTSYLVDDLNPTGYPQVVEELQGGAVTRQYTYGLQRIDENQFINNAWTPSFYGYDGGGNVRELTNAAGTVTDQYEFDAYGNSFTVSGSTPNEMMYRGEQFDSDLGLYYLRARYYNPQSGRFMSRDPLDGKIGDPRSLHKYLYASGDPVNRIDPSGRDDLVEVDLETAEVRFSSHGLAHLTELGYGDPLTQAEVEAYVEEAVRDFIAEAQGAGTTLGRPFDVMFVMQQLGNVPWAARVFIVSSALIQVSTYFPQGIP